MKSTALLILLLFYKGSVLAQDPILGCGQAPAMTRLFQQRPDLLKKHNQIDSNAASFTKRGPVRRMMEDVITLPVVFHIIHNNGYEDISFVQITRGLQLLNESFANTGFYNPATGVDTKIQFCLAQRDPNGNPTNAVNRIVSAYTNTAGSESYTDDLALKNLSRWDPNCYINIWVVNDIIGNVAGYAYLPSAHGSDVDGIVVESWLVGTLETANTTLSHEMGHYLGLYHTFENGCFNLDCALDGDRVCDTPPDNSAGAVSCNAVINSCTTDMLSGFSVDQNDLVDNYMDYGNQLCRNSFTQGQKDRMRWHIENVRSSLLNCRSCLPPCPAPVIADFTSSGTNIPAGTTVNFTNTSTGATTYEWFINGASQGTTPNFSFQFNTAGTYIVKLVAHTGNPTLCADGTKQVTITVTCPVQADFTASSVEVSPGTMVTFTNNSAGSPVSNEWYVNGVLISSTADASYNFEIAGEHAVKLIVSSGVCTSVKEILVGVYTPCSDDYFDKMIGNNDMYHMLAQDMEQFADSSIITCGRVEDYTPGLQGFKGFVIRHTKKGNVDWGKFVTATGFQQLLILDMKKLQDGTSAYVGQSNNASTGVFVFKMNASGTIVWGKNFPLDPSMLNLHYQQTFIEEASDGSLILSLATQPTTTTGRDYTPVIARLTANGDLIWAKKLNDITTGRFGPRSVVADRNSVYWALDNPDAGFLVKLNLHTGDIIFKQRYVLVTARHNNLHFREMKIRDNMIQIYGSNPADGAFADMDSVKHMMIHIDTFGVFQKVARVKLNAPGNDLYPINWFMDAGTVTTNGDFVVIEMPVLPVDDIPLSIYRGDINNNTVFSKTIARNDKSRWHYKLKEGVYGNIIIYGVVDSKMNSTNLNAKTFIYNGRFDAEIGGTCSTGPLTYTKPSVAITQSEFTTSSYTDLALSADPVFNIFTQDPVLSVSLICGAQPTNCYKVRIEGMDTVCGLTDSITYVVKRNPGCTDSIKWTVSPATYGSRLLSDSSIRVRFSQYGDYRITGTVKYCETVSDTVYVHVSRAANTLNIGPDIQLCDLSTYTMKAGTGFKSYRWQNGSVDSTLTVYMPGTYHVTVTDSCGNTKSDTVVISLAPVVPFDLGNDLKYCSNDTVTISAPAGFTDYSWASPYNISSTSGQVVKVWPSVDTIYTVIAKVAEACIVMDSVRITVGTALPLALGDDIKLCIGESAILDAGAGFNSYEWSTGSTGQSITVNRVGAYSIKATAENGCISKDTVIVLDVFTPPVINLGDDRGLCENATLVLDAGPGFDEYEWSTGATASQIIINAAGTYWVKGTDGNGCISTDTIHITGVSQCKNAIYFPKGFTPNGDSRNDHFRPGVYGVLKSYHIVVYNRWGQKVFESKDPGKGWDGRFGGKEQETANFVWFATYQFEGEQPQTAKGSVILIR